MAAPLHLQSSKHADAIELSSCKLPDLTQPAQCGVLYVPENSNSPAGRQLPINVAVIRARGERTRADPIVVLMGGPGESAISAGSIYAKQLAPLLNDRDLLLVDQRGAGRSGALPCDLATADDPAARLRDLFPLPAVKKCEERLRVRADLTQYTYPHFADDLERVRKALDYGPLNLFGGSYGTRAEQVYVRAYPKSVRTAYFGSVVPVDDATPLAMASTAQVALGHLFSACATDAACGAAFPNLKEEFRAVSARLESGTVRVAVPGHAGTWPLTKGRVAEWIRAKLYRPGSAAILPWMIHRAYAGDWSPIAGDILSTDDDNDFSLGLFFAITCNEDVPFLRDADVVAQTQGTFLGDDRVRQQQAACRYWPRAALPPAYREAVHSSVPALFVTGDADGGTPLWYTHHVSEGFSNAVEIVIRGQGHTEWNDCVSQLYQRLVRDGSVSGLKVPKCEPIPRPAFKTS
jgi:pimeloyl-ACP methyl ester carboxylesterase